MKIETKFDTKQEVWLIHNNNVVKMRIEKVSYSKDERDGKEGIEYTLLTGQDMAGNSAYYRTGECRVFATKEELINSL